MSRAVVVLPPEPLATLPRRAPLPAEGRAAAEARPRPSRPDRLPLRPHDHRRRRSPWATRSTAIICGRPLPVWHGCRVVAGGEVFLMNWQSGGLPRRPVFRPAPYHHHRRPGRSSLDARGGLTMPQSCIRSQRLAATASANPLPPFRPSPTFAARRQPRHCTARAAIVGGHRSCDRGDARLSTAVRMPNLSPREPHSVAATARPFAAFVAEASQRFGIPAAWIRAVMHAESFGDVRAMSPKGAMGLMQIMPETWADSASALRPRRRSIRSRTTTSSPAPPICASCTTATASPGFLAAYNAGPAR